MPSKRVLSIGQCCADHSSIQRTFQQHFGAEVASADTLEEALSSIRQGPFDLVLVNRVLDADGASGLNVIRRIKQEATGQNLPVMLVSNYEDAQREAEDLGAVPGFGKAALGQPRMLARVKAYLGSSQ